MKYKSLIFFAIMAMALFISSVVGRASEPMSEEEIKAYKKYEGKWGGGAWTALKSRHHEKQRSVELQISEIDSANRKSKVIYILGEGRKGEAASRATYKADCVDGKLIFETSKNKIELWIKGNDELFVQRKGLDPSEVTLKRIQ
jgi:hypothetical protein